MGFAGLNKNLALLRHVKFHASADEALAALTPCLEHKGGSILSFLNAHAFNLAAHDPEFRAALLSSHFLFRDGVGLKIAARLFQVDPGANLNGTDLIPALLPQLKGKKIALFGSPAGVVPNVAQDWSKKFGLTIVDQADGFQGDAYYLQSVARSTPDVVILGMGMPKQEKLAVALSQQKDPPALIINGGAIFDFAAHIVPRAPKWMRSFGLEWAYRLSREPARLFRRYVLGNPAFLCRVVILRIFSKGLG